MRGPIAYPIAEAADWPRLERPGALERLALLWRDRRYRRRGRRIDAVRLELVGGEPLRPVARRDLVLVTVARNVAAYLPAFLDHYRRLGVARFAVVDDRSDDGTAALLDAAPDVDRFRSAKTYRESGGGLAWRDALIDLYGRERWIVSVDADEFLVFPGSETRALPDFVTELERDGVKRILAPMLDLYPAGRLGDAAFDPGRHRHPTDVSPLIDGGGYTIGREKFSLAVRGGPRTRLFGGENRLSKFPLLFADARTAYRGGSIHGPLPLARNFGPVAGALLHFKFSAASVEEFRSFVREGGHFGGSMFYRRITEHEGFGDDLVLSDEASIPFAGSQDLVRRGFMRSL